MHRGIIFDIKRFAIHDGPGIRSTVFLKGCVANCWWCHNPESQLPTIERTQKTTMLDGFKIAEEQIIGKKMGVTQVMEEIKKDIIFYDQSNGGVTFSGGEPLMQIEFLSELLDNCRDLNIHTIVDTSGYVSTDILHSIIDKVDLYLFDLKLMNNTLHEKYTGVSNDLVIQNIKNLYENEKRVIIRFPVIPTITDTQENLEQLKAFIDSFRGGIEEIDILPYHTLANQKYHRFRMKYKLKELKEPGSDRINNIKAQFEELGLKVKVGG